MYLFLLFLSLINDITINYENKFSLGYTIVFIDIFQTLLVLTKKKLIN